jgi:DNA polymerase lambda
LEALDLVQRGYHCIEQVRSALNAGELHLTRNQRIGVKCYEDILEEMSRDEVESIGKIVIDAFQSLTDSPAEVTIMGSYRRGKATSGDVDVMITLKEHKHSVPRDALKKLVDLLFARHHIAYHLTYLPGMLTGVLYNNEPFSPDHMQALQRQMPITKGPLKSTAGRSKAAKTYMGVFKSPMVPGKRRRVDIKIYPYSQKAFACLYFTGSAHFNRSMRLWAKQRLNLKMTDRGLFDIGTGKKVMDGSSSEEEVFERLNLCYKAPPDRQFFDDVVPLSS